MQGTRGSGRRAALVVGLVLVWAVAKWAALDAHVWRPDEYSDTYYFFLQCRRAASGGGLAVLAPEYPTPAAALLMLPWWLGAQDHASYRLGFLVLVTAVDAAFVLLLAARTSAIGVVAWILLETLAGPLALLRFDVVPAALAGAAVLLVLQARAPAAGVLVAAGTAVKAWPILLAPPVLGDRATRRPAAVAVAATGGVFALVSIAAAGWGRLWSPLVHQRDRGLQIEAVAATGPMLERLGDPAFEVFWSPFNAYEIAGPGTDALLAATSGAAVAAAVLYAVLLVVWFRAGSPPDAAAYLALFAIAAFMATSRALSPQYVLWLAAPAAVLLGEAWRAPGPADAARAARATVTFAGVAALVGLTALVYPVLYDELLAGEAAPAYVLTARNALLVAFAAWCAAASVSAGGAASRAGSRPGRGRP
nr:DUF2029 domain-containing protein [Propionibacterium sp.]